MELFSKKVKIIVSDPWDFQDVFGSPYLFGTIKDINATETQILVHLENSFFYNGITSSQITCSNRYINETMELLSKNNYVIAAMLMIADDYFKQENPFQHYDMRYTVGLLGSITLLKG